MSTSLRLYTQDNCTHCNVMKTKLMNWGLKGQYEEINISNDPSGKGFLKLAGHKTVPQLYFRWTHLNKKDTKHFELIDMFKEMMAAYEEDVLLNLDGGLDESL